MSYNFDKIIDRSKSRSVKWDLRKKKFGNADLIPLWVADMDFETPDFIIDAIKKRIEHPILGYTLRGEEFDLSVKNWMQKRHQWNIDPAWIEFSPGIVSALAVAVMQYTSPGDKILIQSPVYFPFKSTILDNGRQVTENKLKLTDNKYEIDFIDLERKIDSRTKMLMLCNPHNPVGRVFTKTELTKIGELAIKHNLIILSDEIHSDLIFDPHKHIPIASLSPQIAERTLTMISASKSFNVAGLSTSAIIIPNKDLRTQYQQMLENMHLFLGNIFGYEALTAAYTHGEQWIEELMTYLKSNLDFVRDFLAQNMPKIKLIEPESTYLLWLDFRELNLSRKELRHFLYKKSAVALNEGASFGETGNGFMRMNIATPKALIEQALKQIKTEYNKL